jgi:hypothetical protein
MQTPYDTMIFSIATAEDVYPSLLQAIVCAESNGDAIACRTESSYLKNAVVDREAKVTSKKFNGVPSELTERYFRSTSFGLTQIMGQVARENGFTDQWLTMLLHPEVNLSLACKILRTRLNISKSLQHAIGMWNGGPGITWPTKSKTIQAYVSKVLKFMDESPYDTQ